MLLLVVTHVEWENVSIENGSFKAISCYLSWILTKLKYDDFLLVAY